MAGWIAGYAMALLSTAAFTFILATSGDFRVIRWLMPDGLPPLLAAVPLSLGLGLAWSMFGLVFGSGFALFGPEEGDGAVPSLPLLLGVVATGLMPLPLLLIFWARRWWIWSVLSASFIGLFGFAMPLLATR